MDVYTLNGRLRIHRGNINSDLLYLKEHVGKISEPVPEKIPSARGEYMYVEFAATPAQWRILEPELVIMGITATILENPDYAEEVEIAEQRYLTRIGKKSNLWFIYLIGVMIWFAGLLSIS